MSMNLNVKSSMMESVSAPEQPQVDVLAAGVRQNRRGRGSLRGLNLSADSEGASHEMSALLQLSSNDVTEKDVSKTVKEMVNKLPNISKDSTQLQVFSSALWTYIENEKKQKKLTSEDISKVHQSMRDEFLSELDMTVFLKKLKTFSESQKKEIDRVAIDIYNCVKESDKNKVLKLNDDSDQEFQQLLSKALSQVQRKEVGNQMERKEKLGRKGKNGNVQLGPKLEVDTQSTINATTCFMQMSDGDILKAIVYWIFMVICCFVICWVLVIGCCGEQNPDDHEGGEKQTKQKLIIDDIEKGNKKGGNKEGGKQ